MTVDKVVTLVEKPPHERGAIDVELSVAWLKNNCEVFRELSRDSVRDVIKNCGYQRVEEDEVILTQGDMGTCMFVMLSGRTSVYITNFTIDVDSPPERGDRAQPLADKEGRSLDRNVFGKYIISFDGCRRFGEMALMGEGSPRNATIVADRTTDLLVIDKALFDRALKSQEERQYQSRKDFINQSALFGRWPPQLKRLLDMSLRKEIFTFNNRICAQGDPVKALFFVSSGQVKLQVDAEMHKRQYPLIWPKISERKEDLVRDGTSLCSIQKHIRLRRKGGYSAAEQRHMDRTRDACFLQDNTMFGDIEAVLPLSTYLYTAVSVTCSEVYVLENKHVERLIWRKNQKTAERLKSIVFSKIRQRMQTDALSIMAPLAEIMKTNMPRLTNGSQDGFTTIISGQKRNDGSNKDPRGLLSRPQSRTETYRQNSGRSNHHGSIPRSIRDLTGLELHSFQRKKAVNRANSHPAKPSEKHTSTFFRRPSTAPALRRQVPSEEGRLKHDNSFPTKSARNRVPFNKSLSHCDQPDMTTTMDSFRAKLDRLEKIRQQGRAMGMSANSNCRVYGADPSRQITPGYEDIETKLTPFCQKMDSDAQRAYHPHTLRSVDPEDLPRLPSRGGRVLVTTHARGDPQVTSQARSADHRHVRRFVMSKQRDVTL